MIVKYVFDDHNLVRINIISFSRYLKNGPNKFEYYITLGWRDLSRTNTLSYWAHFVRKDLFVVQEKK